MNCTDLEKFHDVIETFTSMVGMLVPVKGGR